MSLSRHTAETHENHVLHWSGAELATNDFTLRPCRVMSNEDKADLSRFTGVARQRVAQAAGCSVAQVHTLGDVRMIHSLMLRAETLVRIWHLTAVEPSSETP